MRFTLSALVTSVITGVGPTIRMTLILPAPSEKYTPLSSTARREKLRLLTVSIPSTVTAPPPVGMRLRVVVMASVASGAAPAGELTWGAFACKSIRKPWFDQ